jgi:hypothetical protein
MLALNVWKKKIKYNYQKASSNCGMEVSINMASLYTNEPDWCAPGCR